MLLAALDEETDTQPNTQRSAPYGGYERLQAGKTVLLMDTGSPVSRHVEQCAMAGCLSYELSSGKNLVITNCGLPAPGFEAYLPFARATAAHSTATIDDTSSCHFADSAKLRSWLPGPGGFAEGHCAGLFAAGKGAYLSTGPGGPDSRGQPHASLRFLL